MATSLARVNKLRNVVAFIGYAPQLMRLLGVLLHTLVRVTQHNGRIWTGETV